MTEKELQAVLASNNKPKKKIAKNGSIIILFILVTFGILGSFNIGFDMEKYVSFLKEFKGIIMVLIGSVGTGIAVRNITGGRNDN